MKERRTFCRLCLGNCGVVATLDDDDRIVSVRGDHDHAATTGYACLTGLHSPAAHNSPDRLLHPLKKMPDGSFARISREQALDEIATKLKSIIAASGGKSVGAFF